MGARDVDHCIAVFLVCEFSSGMRGGQDENFMALPGGFRRQGLRLYFGAAHAVERGGCRDEADAHALIL